MVLGAASDLSMKLVSARVNQEGQGNRVVSPQQGSGENQTGGGRGAGGDSARQYSCLYW